MSPDPGSVHQDKSTWDHITDHPKIAGVLALLALAATFSPKASALASWGCIVIAWSLTVAFAGGAPVIRRQNRRKLYTGIIAVCSALGFGAYGAWLTGQGHAREPERSKAYLRVESITANLFPNRPISCTVKIGNSSTATATNPRHTLINGITAGTLGEIGERHLFESLISAANSSISSSSTFEIRPGAAVFFKTGTAKEPAIDVGNIPLDPDIYKQIKTGKKHFYVMVLIQYGPELRHAFDDGIKRAHSVFCAHFSGGLARGDSEDGPYYCAGFNYAMP